MKRTRSNPIKGPGKYEGETYAVRYAHENADEDLGDVEGFGWYGNFSGKIKGRGPFHIITTENNEGFVSGEIFDTQKEMLSNWRRIESEYDEFEEGVDAEDEDEEDA